MSSGPIDLKYAFAAISIAGQPLPARAWLVGCRGLAGDPSTPADTVASASIHYAGPPTPEVRALRIGEDVQIAIGQSGAVCRARVLTVQHEPGGQTIFVARVAAESASSITRAFYPAIQAPHRQAP